MPLEQTAEEIAADLMKKAAKEGWENKSHLLKLLGRAWAFIRGEPNAGKPLDSSGTKESPRPILILGPSGAGKSTLARVLAGDVNVLLDPPEYYEPSIDVETVKLLGEDGVELVVLPGEQYRSNREFGEVTAALVNGAYRGLILVVDYGYHAVKSEWAEQHRLYEEGKRREFLPKLLDAHRKEEIDLLTKLVPSLKAATGKLWVLVVVLKQDLWVSDQLDVETNYEGSGAWGTAMGEVRQAMDGKPFHLRTAYTCLHIQNYTTASGRETLKKNTPGYDAVRQRKSLAKLFENFDALRAWEEKP